jgi:glycosyltransferase involved in cell wall biosynthesis
MKAARVAKIIEIGPYPPPRAGWSIRIGFVRERLEELGHDCQALNIGKNRKIPSDRYITVRSGIDYLFKTFRYAARGYTIHMHTNGDGPLGFLLALIAVLAGCLCCRRIVLTMHAGTHQRYFPRERSKYFLPVLYLMFKLPKTIICNNEAVKQKIVKYGVSPDKIFPIQAFGSSYLESMAEAGDTSLPKKVEAFIAERDPLIFTYAFMREGYHLGAMVECLRLLKLQMPQLGCIVIGSLEDNEPPVYKRIFEQIHEADLIETFCFAGDLSHDQFMQLMRKSKLYLRTPTSDGQCSSVFECLTLGIPVVAAENNNRPQGVITYMPDDPQAMYDAVRDVLANHSRYCARIVAPEVRDTVGEEAEVLIAAALGKMGS